MAGAFPPPAFKEDFFERVVNVKWGTKGCRFAVIGYDGTFDPDFQPTFNGVGAYSDNGKSWTTFKVFQNGSAASVFNMIDPDDGSKNLMVAGGCTNREGEISTSTAALTTVVGSGVAASGGTSNGRNVAGFFNLGYDRDKGAFYAVEFSGNTPSLHTFQIGEPKSPASQTSESGKLSIVWAGAHYPGIGPVYDCTCVVEGFTESDPLGGAGMTFEGRDGKKHTLNIAPFGEETLQLHLDGANITPSGARHVMTAAGGVNDEGETIIIAMGYSLKGTDDDYGIAWWSIDGKGWVEITGIWAGAPVLQVPEMATAVPKNLPDRSSDSSSDDSS